jgi:hypothetical protein
LRTAHRTRHGVWVAVVQMMITSDSHHVGGQR